MRILATFAAIALMTAPAAAADLGVDDLPKLVEARQAGAAEFRREHGGRSFDATLPFRDITEAPLTPGKFSVALSRTGGFAAEVRCEITDVEDAAAARALSQGDEVDVRGLVEDHRIGTLVLRDCELTRRSGP